MAADYRRQFTGGEVGESKDGATASAVWTVTGVSSGTEAKNHADAPVRYNDPWPDDLGSALRCDRVRVTTVSPKFYRLVATFSIPKAGGAHTGPTENPLLAPPEISWETVTLTPPVEKDSAGNAITVSSGRGLDPPAHKTFNAKQLEVRRNEPAFSIATALNYENTVNGGKFSGASAGEVLCTEITTTSAYTTSSSYVNVAYRFLFKSKKIFGDDPHQLRVLDQDTMAVAYVPLFSGYVSESSASREVLVRITDATGRPTDGPVLLNGQGIPIDGTLTFADASGKPIESPSWVARTTAGATLETTSTGAVFLKYKYMYPEIDLAQLGLPI